MAAPAQPKKIVAPTVSQINAEFVTQVRFVESGVCEGRMSRPQGLGGGVFLGTGSILEAFAGHFMHLVLPRRNSTLACLRLAKFRSGDDS